MHGITGLELDRADGVHRQQRPSNASGDDDVRLAAVPRRPGVTQGTKPMPAFDDLQATVLY